MIDRLLESSMKSGAFENSSAAATSRCCSSPFFDRTPSRRACILTRAREQSMRSASCEALISREKTSVGNGSPRFGSVTASATLSANDVLANHGAGARTRISWRWNPRPRAEHAQRQLRGAHLEGEDERRERLAPLRERHSLRDIERERCLAHRRTGREHDHLLALEAKREPVQVVETRRGARHLAPLHHHLVDDVHRLLRRSAHGLCALAHAALRDGEDLVLDLVHELVDSPGEIEAVLDGPRRRADDLAEQVQLADERSEEHTSELQ